MIKIIPKLKTFPTIKFAKFKPKNKLPEVNSPMLAYTSYFMEEDKHQRPDLSSLAKGVGSFLGGMMFNQYLPSENKSETDVREKSEEKTEFKAKSESEVKTQNSYKTYELEEDDDDESFYTYRPIYTHQTYKQSFFERLLNTCEDIIFNPINEIRQRIHNITTERQEKKFEIAQKREALYEKILENSYLQAALDQKEIALLFSSNISKKRIDELTEKVEKLVETQRQKIQEQSIREMQELRELRKEFFIKLEQYKSMFALDDIKPDFSIFTKQGKITIESLKSKMPILEACIAHQEAINALKEKFTLSAKFYMSDKEEKNLSDKFMEKDYYSNKKYTGDEYRNKLCAMTNVFFKNSKMLESSILDLNRVSNKFFKEAKGNIEDIFEMKKKWYFKYLEKVPKLGLVPKAIRVTGQINLTHCIMKDYKAITENHIKKGLVPNINDYNKYYEKIEKFVYMNKRYLSPEDKKYSNKLLKEIKNKKEKYIETYQKIFDVFAKGGCNISNICNKVRLEGLISLVTKTIATFGSPF